MKSEVDFALEQAQWLVLLVDESGVVRRANKAAGAAFAAMLQGPSPLFIRLWSKENLVSAEEFFRRVKHSGSSASKIVIQVQGGTDVLYQTYACFHPKDDHNYYLLQFFPEPAAGASDSVAASQPETQRLAVEAGAAQKQKLDCALQLTRTVALDFNNALTSILGHTSLVLSKMEVKHPWRGSLLEVEKSAEKAAEIAYDLAAFSRQEKDTRSQAAGNLNQLLRRTVELFQGPKAVKASWSLKLENKLLAVVFDEAKMQQAIMKILENSTQAVAAGGGIAVVSRNVRLSEPKHDGAITLTPGDYVCVDISDTGCGIPEAVLPRIFEPFFTTKDGHRGLGLAWVYGIVTNHGGSVAVASRVGQGTSVRIYMPAMKRTVRYADLADDELGGKACILMVDDEDILLTMGQMILSEYGYRVLIANNGARALEIFKSEGPAIDLVITDLVMPNMSGRELIEQLRRMAPSLRILCASGYMPQAKPDEGDETYLQKPFTSQDLLRKVKRVLTQG